jgi:hypothetical protein
MRNYFGPVRAQLCSKHGVTPEDVELRKTKWRENNIWKINGRDWEKYAGENVGWNRRLAKGISKRDAKRDEDGKINKNCTDSRGKMGKFKSQNVLLWPRTMKYLSASDPKQLAVWEPIRPKTCRASLPRMADQEVAESGGWFPLWLVDSAWGSRMGLLFGCSAKCDPPPSTRAAWLHGA